MKGRLRYFIYLSVLLFIPCNLFCQPDIKEPAETELIPVWLWIVMGFLAGFIAGVLLIFQYSRSKIYSIVTNEKYKYLDHLKQETGQNLLVRKLFRYVGIVELLKQSKDAKKKELDVCSKEIIQLRRQNDQLRKVNDEKEKIITDQNSTAYNLVSSGTHFGGEQRKSFAKTENAEIFFTIPEGDGSFKTANAKNSQDVECFYRVIPDKGGQKGKLYFISGDYDLRALDNIDYYLNPVCEIQNISDRSFARKIIMTDPGSVIRRGDIWKIEENNKVKIKLV
jgi:hypothetical protein